MMPRRASDRCVSIMIGGVSAIDDWQVIPFSSYRLPGGGSPEEPFWWTLPTGEIVGQFRDNSRSGRLLSGIEALTELVLIAWTASFALFLVQRV